MQCGEECAGGVCVWFPRGGGTGSVEVELSEVCGARCGVWCVVRSAGASGVGEGGGRIV